MKSGKLKRTGDLVYHKVGLEIKTFWNSNRCVKILKLIFNILRNKFASCIQGFTLSIAKYRATSSFLPQRPFVSSAPYVRLFSNNQDHESMGFQLIFQHFLQYSGFPPAVTCCQFKL